jgi:hypothetical protein
MTRNLVEARELELGWVFCRCGEVTSGCELLDDFHLFILELIWKRGPGKPRPRIEAVTLGPVLLILTLLRTLLGPPFLATLLSGFGLTLLLLTRLTRSAGLPGLGITLLRHIVVRTLFPFVCHRNPPYNLFGRNVSRHLFGARLNLGVVYQFIR